MRPYLLILAFSLITTTSVFAQYFSWTKAEVMLKNGTVLDGEVWTVMMDNNQLNIASKKLKYRLGKKTKVKKYIPQEVEQVLLTVNDIDKDGLKKTQKTGIKKYIPVILDRYIDKYGFVEVIVDGKLKLVGRSVFRNTFSNVNLDVALYSAIITSNLKGTHDVLMLIKKGEAPQVIKAPNLLKSFRNRAMAYFEDCTIVKNKIDKKELKKDDLEYIVKVYNANCN